MNTYKNTVSLIGRLGKEPETKTFETGNIKTTFSLAVNENFKNKKGEWEEKTSWHNIICWGKTAERVNEFLKKGAEVMLEGKLTYNKYQTKEGENREICQIEMRDFAELVQRKKGVLIPEQN